MTNYEIQHQESENLFYIVLDEGQRAHLKYRYSDSKSAVPQVDFYSTLVPNDYRGIGMAAKLVNHAFDWAEQQNLQINTSCWYAAKLYERRVRT